MAREDEVTSQRPVIALLTDFGLSDPYAGVMKGVILSRARDAQLVDLTHLVPPQSVLEGAFLLEMAWRYFPPGTVVRYDPTLVMPVSARPFATPGALASRLGKAFVTFRRTWPAGAPWVKRRRAGTTSRTRERVRSS